MKRKRVAIARAGKTSPTRGTSTGKR